jgi:adenylosuccinate synthase
MPLTVVVGRQDDSEGQGKVTSYLAFRDNVDIVIRCRDPNAGHTVEVGGQRHDPRIHLEQRGGLKLP